MALWGLPRPRTEYLVSGAAAALDYMPASAGLSDELLSAFPNQNHLIVDASRAQASQPDMSNAGFAIFQWDVQHLNFFCWERSQACAAKAIGDEAFLQLTMMYFPSFLSCLLQTCNHASQLVWRMLSTAMCMGLMKFHLFYFGGEQEGDMWGAGKGGGGPLQGRHNKVS